MAVLALVGTLAGAYLANRKSAALIAYRLEQLEKKQDKYNNLQERTYELEKTAAVHEEQFEAVNHRIDDLEKQAERA